MADTLTVDNWGLTEITLDYANQYIPDVLIANANDMQGRGIDLYVTKDGQALNMSGMTVYLAWSHENGNQDLTKFTATSSTTGHFRVKYPNAMMYGGKVLARICIYVSSSAITGSRDFQILVERNPIDEDSAMSSENMSAFKDAVKTLSSLESSIRSAESSRVSAENTRKSNETARQSAETARQSAETSRASAEASRVSAEASRVNAEKARVTAESKREKDSAEAVEAANTAAANANASVINKVDVATGEAGSMASGSLTNNTLNLTIPRGDKGDTGDTSTSFVIVDGLVCQMIEE